MTIRQKRTIDQRIAEAQAKLKALEEKKKAKEEKVLKTKKVILTKDSAGMPELLSQIQEVANANKMKVAEVVMAISRIKRTGLIFRHRSTNFDDVMGM